MATYSSILASSSMDRGAWRATIHGVTKLDTTEQLTFTFNYQSTGRFQVIIAQNYHCYLNISHGLPLVPKKGIMLSWLSQLGLKFFDGSLMALVLMNSRDICPLF